MAKRVKLWPNKGGDPIEVFEADANRFVKSGWVMYNPADKPAEKPPTTKLKSKRV